MEEKITTFKYLKVFIIGVIALVILSIGIKVGSEYLSASFKSDSFNILYIGKESYLVGVDTSSNTFSFVKLPDLKEITQGKNLLQKSMIVGVPVNAQINDRDTKTYKDADEFLTNNSAWNILFGPSKKFRTKINSYDVISFFHKAKGSTNKRNGVITLEFNEKNDKILSDLFQSDSLRRRATTVEIINGSSVDGLGTSLSRALTNAGYNIISVGSAGGDEDSYIGYSDEQLPEIELLKSFINFNGIMGKNSPAADITIFLGKDYNIPD